MKVGLKHFLTGVALFGSLHTRAYAQDNIVYDTSPSSGRVVSIRVEDTAPIKLPAVEIPVNASSQEIASAIAQLASATPQPSPSPAPLKYARMVRSSNPITTAASFLKVYGKAFGLSNPARELSPLKEEKDLLGMSHVRFQQNYKGVPVFGAELVAHVGADGRIRSINGKVGSGIDVSTRSKITKSRATTIAKRYFLNKYSGAIPGIGKVMQYVYQGSILNNASSITSHLVWSVKASNIRALIDETYLIDAVTGNVLLDLNNVRQLNRRVLDCSATLGEGDNCYSNYYSPEHNYTFGCREGLCPHGANPRYPQETSLDTDAAYELLSELHGYYKEKFNLNGANGFGGNTDGSQLAIDVDAIWTYVNWLSSWLDDCKTATYFSFHGIYLCKGMVVPDIVGHEYAHGINSRLLYEGESGALNENYSDVIGEMFEYWKTGSNNWLSGQAAISGTQISLIDPPSIVNPVTGLPYPDRYTSDFTYCGTLDHSGVHMNSTILSKAAYLLGEGGDFNGCMITPIQRSEIEQIWHKANTLYYSSTENFNGAYYDLIQSCVDLYGEGGTCREVARALQSVELDQVGKCSDPSHSLSRPPTCACEDSDDWRGEGRLPEQLHTAGVVEHDGSTFRDLCLNRNVLIESFCKNGKQKRAIVKCDGGCIDGACA